MKFREAISSVFRQYATFQGRARRSEYWYFVLFNVLVYGLMFVVSTLLLSTGVTGRTTGGLNSAVGGMGLLYILYGIYSLGTIIPGLALLCRRLHDIGRAGSYMLFAFIPFVGLIFLLIWVLQEGEAGPNRYGPDPKQNAAGDDPVRQPKEERKAPQAREQHYTPRPYIITEPVSDTGARNAERAVVQFYLEGVAGCFRGKRVPVRGSVTAGRHPSCGICFPKDTHGVSARHCQFRANGSSLVVTDVGSSYGTFVNNRRLPPNCPFTLSRGDTILLGSAKQGFRVVS